MCKTDLVDKIGGDPRITGFRAHITADSPGGPRYDASLDDKQRNGYGNIMLLCGDCHTKVDKAPDHYTVAVLHAIKAQHEEYCTNLLTVDDERRAITGEILANAVDLVVEGISLEQWGDWTRHLLGPGKYRWPEYALKEFRYVVRPALQAVLWPAGVATLEISSKMLVDAVMAFEATFSRQSTTNRNLPGYLVCDSITQTVWNPEYPISDPHGLERQLKQWDETLQIGLVHAAKCANWFAEAVREHVNPRFRVKEGSFILDAFHHLAPYYGVYSFTEAEKQRTIAGGYQPGFHVWKIVRATWDTPPTPEYGDGDPFEDDE
jgi:hypothetical protein